MRVLGISAFYHDSAAALVEEGSIVAAALGERFTRKKHDPGFPNRAIDYCLAEAGCRLSDLDWGEIDWLTARSHSPCTGTGRRGCRICSHRALEVHCAWHAPLPLR